MKLRFLPFLIGLSGLTSQGQVAEWLSAEDFVPAKVCSDPLDNVFIAGQFLDSLSLGGTTFSSNGLQDVAVVKRNPSGQLLWAITFGNPQADYVYDLEYDHNGHIWVLGVFQGSLSIGAFSLVSQGSNDIFIVKLDAASGAVLFAASAGGPGNDAGMGLETTSNGEIFVSGLFIGSFSYGGNNLSGPSYEVFLLKLDNNGSLNWSTSISGPGIETMWSLAADDAGNAYVCGMSTSANVSYGTVTQSMQGQNHFIAKFNGNGQFQWSALSSFSGEIVSACVDTQGRLYFTGNFDTQATFGNITLTGNGADDILVGRLVSNGTYDWVYNVGGPGHDEGKDIVYAGNGDVYLVGNFQAAFTWDSHLLSSSGIFRNFVARLNDSGNVSWLIQTQGAANNHLMQSAEVSPQALYVATAAYGTTALGGLSANVNDGLVARLLHNANIVQGKVFADVNGNAQWDSTEAGLPGVVVLSVNNPSASTTSWASGHYELPVHIGTHQVALASLPQYYSHTGPGSYQVSFSSLGNFAAGYDFPLLPQPNVNDLKVDITVLTLPKPGYVLAYMITCQNVGTTSQNASLTFQFDPQLAFLTSAPAPSGSNGNHFSWNLGTLNPLASVQVIIQFQVPVSAPLGSPLQAVAHLYPQAGDNNPSNNEASVGLVVVGPYDPNYKEVDMDTLWSVDPASFLTYTIHFQNVGNAPAHTVVLRDTLSAHLLAETIEIVAASHQPMQWTLKNGHVLEFRFDNIMLPDSASDPVGSCGFVKFKVKHSPSLPLNTVVANFADIYFDYNLPIRTNTATTVYAQLSSSLQNYSEEPGLRLYPNPASQQTTVEWIAIESPLALNVLDKTGRTIRSLKISGPHNTCVVPLLNLPPAIYILELQTSKGLYREKLLVY